MKSEHKTCKIDGKEYSISNLQIPFGIFSGRGNNKQIGRIRKEIQPKDVIINSTNSIPVPDIFKG